MKYAYFPGCKIAHHLPAHGQSVEAVCTRLGFELMRPEFSCCGYPVRQESRDASVYSALRNLALCARLGLDLMTPPANAVSAISGRPCIRSGRMKS
jgi:heterodisulfide reductase subunit B